jgi:hypothetical protein
MKLRSFIRIGCIAWLVAGLVASVSLLSLAIVMEGMRHSGTSSAQFDRYYWSAALPTVLSGYWLTVVFVRLSTRAVLTTTTVSVALSIWWVAIISEDGVKIAVVAAFFSTLSFFASCLAKKLGPNETVPGGSKLIGLASSEAIQTGDPH